MSNKNLDDFQRQSAEEEFLRLAALEIESEENEIFLEAQDLPDPDPEVLQGIQAKLLETMRKSKKKQRNRKIFFQLGRLTACAAALCCLLITGVYFGVDAARLSINNFVMELFDSHSIVWTTAAQAQTGASLPTDWDGPFSVTWVPTRFTNVQAKDFQTFWNIIYSSSVEGEDLFVYVWNSTYAPSVNTEDMILVSQEDIQDSPASIYSDATGSICTLIWVKSDYVIQIGGTISPDEAKKIAENFNF